MPIWSVTCCQFCSLILMMRLAMLFTSCSLRQHSGVLRMVAMGRIRIFSCDSTRLASSASLHTTVKPPTRSPGPMFLRTAQASRSMSPLAKPWYAMSKNGSRFLF
uniref:Secreted protein n=1 Tax=Paramormyrops kingsleyae TaxID=1676925 RepID=A0A3B3RCB2_9TELE